jgi:predicted component of type VI protein secretion system
VAVTADIDPAAAELVDERAATVLAIAREALRNAERHAQARQLTLTLQPENVPAPDSDEPARWRLSWPTTAWASIPRRRAPATSACRACASRPSNWAPR